MQREFRLRRKEDFAHLRQHGRHFHNRMLTLSLAANGLEHNRYGFITSKQLGKAVQRNRARRLLRESVRHLRLQSGFDVVLIARRDLVGQPFMIVCRTVEELFRRAGLVESDLS